MLTEKEKEEIKTVFNEVGVDNLISAMERVISSHVAEAVRAERVNIVDMLNREGCLCCSECESKCPLITSVKP